jgi:hypothetical protein
MKYWRGTVRLTPSGNRNSQILTAKILPKGIPVIYGGRKFLVEALSTWMYDNDRTVNSWEFMQNQKVTAEQKDSRASIRSFLGH